MNSGNGNGNDGGGEPERVPLTGTGDEEDPDPLIVKGPIVKVKLITAEEDPLIRRSHVLEEARDDPDRTGVTAVEVTVEITRKDD